MRSLVAVPLLLLSSCSRGTDEAETHDADVVLSDTDDVSEDTTPHSDSLDSEGDSAGGADVDSADSRDIPDATDVPADTAAPEWCHDGVCGPPPVTFHGIPDPFGHLIVHDASEDVLGLGSGAGFIDFDGDGDVDVFLGGSFGGTTACLYRNDSSPGVFLFTPVPQVCDRVFPRPVYFATAIQIDDDPSEELLVAGSRFLELLDMDTGDSTDLIATLELNDTRRRCDVMNVRRVDVDADGFRELYVACGHTTLDAAAKRNIVFDYDDGTWRPWGIEESGPLAVGGATLALALTDLERDGLTDIFYANDTFSSPDQRNVLEVPGGWLRQVEPGVWRDEPFSQDETRFGSFMGAAFLPIEGADSLIVTDWGPLRLVDVATRAAREFPAATGWFSGRALFSWSVVTFDFDGNGLLDAYVTFGDIHAAGLGHEDTLYLHFESGFAPLVRSHSAPRDELPYRSSRGATLVDLDGDGTPELFTLPLRGHPSLDRVEFGGNAPICRVIRDPGALTLSATIGDASWTLDSWAQSRFSAPTTPFVRGVPTVSGGQCAE